MQLKLVGAQRYVDLRISDEVIQNGAVVEVEDDVGEALLGEVVYDSLNNANPLFVEDTTPQLAKKVAEVVDAEEAGEEPVTEPRARRAATKPAPVKSKKA